jgi:hypothetical protein
VKVTRRSVALRLLKERGRVTARDCEHVYKARPHDTASMSSALGRLVKDGLAQLAESTGRPPCGRRFVYETAGTDRGGQMVKDSGRRQ